MQTHPPDLAEWPEGPTSPSLEPGAVHVWGTELTPDVRRRDDLAAYLSTSELERAARFRFDDDATRYTIGRGLLRRLLARYVGGSPSEIELGETEHGRPVRLHPQAHSDLDFNLSHSKDLALFAFCRGTRVGIDLEWLQPLDDMDDLVEIHFSAHERDTYHSLDPSQRRSAFFDCWTRKEAFVKAIGEGLSHPLDAFDVSFAPGEPPRLLRLASAPDDLARWSIYALDPADGYAACLAIEAPTATVQCYRVRPDAI